MNETEKPTLVTRIIEAYERFLAEGKTPDEAKALVLEEFTRPE